MLSECPENVRMSFPSAASHSLTRLSLPPVAISLPSGLTEMLRQGLAVALPVGLLLLAVFLTYAHEAVTPATGEGLFPIKPVELASVRESYATRRVRNAIELFRLSEGRWPDRLGELEERELFESNELAAPSGRPYYSANRDDGFYVLAPER